MEPNALNTQLLAQGDQAFYGPAWHGPSLWPTLKKLKLEEALGTGTFEGRSAWQVALHSAYWKHRVSLGLAKASRGKVMAPHRFFRGPADWPRLPEPANRASWRLDLERIHEIHLGWRAVVESFPPELWGTDTGRGFSASDLAFGASAHDLYHAAMIRNMGVKHFR